MRYQKIETRETKKGKGTRKDKDCVSQRKKETIEKGELSVEKILAKDLHYRTYKKGGKKNQNKGTLSSRYTGGPLLPTTMLGIKHKNLMEQVKERRGGEKLEKHNSRIRDVKRGVDEGEENLLEGQLEDDRTSGRSGTGARQ